MWWPVAQAALSRLSPQRLLWIMQILKQNKTKKHLIKDHQIVSLLGHQYVLV